MMNAKESKHFEQRLEAAEEAFKTLNENKKKIKELSWAIEELKDNLKYPSEPNQPSSEYFYDKAMKKHMDEYDDSHKPKEHYMTEGIGWWILFLTLPFVGACFAYFNGGDTIQDMASLEKILFIALCVVGPIPVIVFLVDIFLIISYKPRLNSYFKKNRKRLQEIENYKPKAEKSAAMEYAKYERKCEEYKIQLAKYNEDSEKINRYNNKYAELKKAVKENEALLSEIFDELNTPKEYRDEHHLSLIKTMFLVDLSSLTAETTVADSLQHAYDVFRESDEEYEIAQLANRRMNREIEKINAERAARLAAKLEKEEDERRKREEAQKRKEWEELDKWAEIVESQ